MAVCASPGIEFKEMLRWNIFGQDLGPEVPIHTSGFLPNCHVRGKHGKNQGFRRKDPWISTVGSSPIRSCKFDPKRRAGHMIGSLCIDCSSILATFEKILVTPVPTHVYVRRRKVLPVTIEGVTVIYQKLGLTHQCFEGGIQTSGDTSHW